MKNNCKYFLVDIFTLKSFVHFYPKKSKAKIIETVSSGRGAFPYEKVHDFDSLDSVDEDGLLFKKEEFFSALKQNDIADQKSQNSRYLYSQAEDEKPIRSKRCHSR